MPGHKTLKFHSRMIDIVADYYSYCARFETNYEIKRALFPRLEGDGLNRQLYVGRQLRNWKFVKNTILIAIIAGALSVRSNDCYCFWLWLGETKLRPLCAALRRGGIDASK